MEEEECKARLLLFGSDFEFRCLERARQHLCVDTGKYHSSPSLFCLGSRLASKSWARGASAAMIVVRVGVVIESVVLSAWWGVRQRCVKCRRAKVMEEIDLE